MVIRQGGPMTEPLWHRVWLDNYPCDVPSSIPYPRVPVSTLLEMAARRFPYQPACTIYGKSMSYSKLNDQSHRLAHALASLGAKPGRRVAMLLPNIPEYIVALQATWLTGATVLQLSPLMVSQEISKWLERTGCHIIFTLDLLAPLVMPALVDGPLEHVIVASVANRLKAWKGWLYRIVRLHRNGPFRLRATDHIHYFEHVLRNTAEAVHPKIDPEEDVALMSPTGGTTASPKAVMLTHRNLVSNAFQLGAWSREEDGHGGILGVLPFFHAYGLTVGLLTGLAKGATIHLHPRFELKAVLKLLLKHKPDLVPAVPQMIAGLNRELRKNPADLSFIRAVVSGASALPNSVREEFERYGAQNVVEGYGLSEASPVTHVNPIDGNMRPGTIGLPLPDTEARIVDQATGLEELPVGVPGELIIRGPQVMKGYFENPTETARALRNGWLYTGDIAKRDADGFFTIVDRKKDIIKTNGFLVYPAEVEEVIRSFPTVAEAAVVGVPDADRGELVKALVVPRAGDSVHLSELEAHCLKHLGKHKRPKIIEVVDELPKNFLGKVQRRFLREQHRANGETANPQNN
ncbi:MAG: long-chain-fatty-acid--CoA ligase [Gemmatales bacterium]|nr:MAG: long-chain-fatty-acid--CoA ligase [Gemmatales bacterium]